MLYFSALQVRDEEAKVLYEAYLPYTSDINERSPGKYLQLCYNLKKLLREVPDYLIYSHYLATSKYSQKLLIVQNPWNGHSRRTEAQLG